MTPQPTGAGIAIIIPTWNGWVDLAGCLRSLPRDRRRDVIVVDNGSADGTVQNVRAEFPDVQVIALPHNTGFAFAVNRGIEAAGRRDIVLLNNDTVVLADWFDELWAVTRTAAPRVGFVQCKMICLHDDRLDTTGDMQSWAGLPVQRGHGEIDRGQWDDDAAVFSACGGASWYRREMLDDVGLFTERFFAYYEDVDLCSRAQLRGWTGQFAARAVVRHAVSASAGRVPGFKRFQSTRNGWWLVFRTMPSALLPRVLPRLVVLNGLLLVQALLHGEFRSAVRGHVAAVRGLTRTWQERRAIQATATVSATQFSETFVSARTRRVLGQFLGALLLRLSGPVPTDAVGGCHNADAALRYRPLVKRIAGAGRVLEVGSGSVGITAYSPLLPVVGVDADFAATAELSSSTLVKVTARGSALPFPDNTFDACLSVDSFEHVPKSARGPFVREMKRVTRPGGRVILACPVGALAGRADALVDQAFRRRYGRPHPWLQEHLAEGLPTDQELRQLMGGSGTLKVTRNAWLPLWVVLQRLALSSHDYGAVERLVGTLAQRFAWAPCYRRIYELQL